MNLGQKIGLALGSVAVAAGGVFGVAQLAHGSGTQDVAMGGMPGAPGQAGGQQGAGPGGVSGGQQTDGTQSVPGGQQSTGTQGMAPGGGGQSAPTELVTAVASAFNLSTDKAQTAVETAFSTVQTQNLQPGDAMDSALASSLATQLGVDEAKVKQVLTEVRASMPDAGAPADDTQG